MNRILIEKSINNTTGIFIDSKVTIIKTSDKLNFDSGIIYPTLIFTHDLYSCGKKLNQIVMNKTKKSNNEFNGYLSVNVNRMKFFVHVIIGLSKDGFVSFETLKEWKNQNCYAVDHLINTLNNIDINKTTAQENRYTSSSRGDHKYLMLSEDYFNGEDEKELIYVDKFKNETLIKYYNTTGERIVDFTFKKLKDELSIVEKYINDYTDDEKERNELINLYKEYLKEKSKVFLKEKSKRIFTYYRTVNGVRYFRDILFKKYAEYYYFIPYINLRLYSKGMSQSKDKSLYNGKDYKYNDDEIANREW